MKNYQLQFALALLSICALSACNTVSGMGKDVGDTSDWAHNQPSTLGQFIGEAPSGYHEQPAEPATPLQTTENSLASQNQTQAQNQLPLNIVPPGTQSAGLSHNYHRLDWHQINHYNAEDPSLPEGQEYQAAPQSVHNPSAAPAVQYNHSVVVFPVNGDITPYTQINSIKDGDIGGEMVQQIFFGHGSANMSRIDRKDLHELAQSLVQNTGDYKLDVVGHASHRVNHVRDPIEKRMINFKMAQRRANAVAGELIKAGVTPDWVVAISQGDEQPNPRRNGKTQEAADRRAEVFLNTN